MTPDTRETISACIGWAAIWFAALLLMVGCAPSLAELRDNHSALRVKVVSPYAGTLEASRVNPQPGQTARVMPDGTIEVVATPAK